MKYRINISKPARRDMESALDWTLEQFGERQRDEYAELIQLALFDIERDPEQPLARRRTDLHEDARIFHIRRTGRHARHLFVFRVRPAGVIQIARFLHDAMDIPRHVPPSFRK